MSDSYASAARHLVMARLETNGNQVTLLSEPTEHSNVHVLAQTPQLLSLLTMIRDKETGRVRYRNAGLQLTRTGGFHLLLEPHHSSAG